jgi:hypothetical protein
MVVAPRRAAVSLADRREEVQPLVDRAVTHALHLGLTPAQLVALVRKSLEEHRSCMNRPS